jgi:hypothetical protein
LPSHRNHDLVVRVQCRSVQTLSSWSTT